MNAKYELKKYLQATTFKQMANHVFSVNVKDPKHAKT